MKQQKQFEFEWQKGNHSEEQQNQVKELTLQYKARIKELEFEKDIAIDKATGLITDEIDELVAKVKTLRDARLKLEQDARQKIVDQIKALKVEQYTKLLEIIKPTK